MMGVPFRQGRTPLHRAAMLGRFEVTLAILQEVGHQVQHSGDTHTGWIEYVDK